MPTIVPAILTEDIHGFNAKLASLLKIHDLSRIQVDFCDSNFVSNHSVPISDFDLLNPSFVWEAHLMIRDPKDFLDYKLTGFSTIIIHYEAFASEQALEQAVEAITALGLAVGIAINPETEVSVLRYFVDTIKHFTLLSVHPGKQGGQFLLESLQRLESLRKLAPDAIIEVDGGIKTTNASSLANAGADLLVVGSALFETENLQENFDMLSNAVNIKTS